MLGYLVVLSVGCRPSEEITQYTIPKPESIQLPKPAGVGVEKTPGSTAQPGRPERMLGAIVPAGEQLWFFKITGPLDAVASRTEEFQTFVRSLKFTAKKEPEWTLPAGWSSQQGSGMRFATVTVSETPPLEVSVIALPNVGTDLPEQILANVNRWRDQLSLEPVTNEQLQKDTSPLATSDGIAVTLVDYTGTTKGGGMMAAPFAQGLGRPSPAATLPEAAPATTPSPLKFKTPEGWVTGRVGGMRKAAFDMKEGDQTAELTVIDLAKGAGDRLANVNRWRGQIGLEPVTQEELTKTMTTIPVGTLKGDFVELVGPVNGERAQTILGAIVEQGDAVWFIKLQGDSTLVAAQKAKFEEFAKSLELE